MTTPRILVVEDEEECRVLLRESLKGLSAEVLEAATAASAGRLFESCHPEIVLLDLALPDRDGLELCREFREKAGFSSVGILVVSARQRVEEKKAALEAGADDYLTKPFDPAELRIRTEALLARYRARATPSGEIAAGGLQIDPEAQRVFYNGRPIPTLSPREFEILRCLAEKAGKVVSRRYLYRRVWNQPWYKARRALDVHVFMLRKKLGPAGSLIQTIPMIGYRLSSASLPPSPPTPAAGGGERKRPSFS